MICFPPNIALAVTPSAVTRRTVRVTGTTVALADADSDDPLLVLLGRFGRCLHGATLLSCLKTFFRLLQTIWSI